MNKELINKFNKNIILQLEDPEYGNVNITLNVRDGGEPDIMNYLRTSEAMEYYTSLGYEASLRKTIHGEYFYIEKVKWNT